jgi:hypothetical protein
MGILSRRGASPIQGATLDLDFRTRIGRRRGSTGNIIAAPVDQIVSESRYTSGWCYGQNGELTEFDALSPRYAANPLTRVPLGLLTEPGAYNISPNSDNFTYWGASSATVTVGAADIHGGFAASILASTGSGGYTSAQLSITAATQYWSHSFVVKSTAQMWTQLYLSTASGGGSVTQGIMTFDPVLGRIVSIVNTTGTVYGKIEPAPGGKWRVTVWGYNTAASANFINLAIGFTTTGTATIESSQIEAIGGNSSIIVTPAPYSNLRLADLPTISLTSNNYWFNQSQGTIYAELIHNGPTSAQEYILSISDGTSNNLITLVYDNTTGNYFWQANVAGVAAASIQMRGSARGNLLRFALTFINGGVWTAAKTGGGQDYTVDSLNGTLASSSSAVPSASLTRLDIGHAFTNAPAHMTIQRLAFIPRQVDQATLSELVQA